MLAVREGALGSERAPGHLPVPANLGLEFLLKVTLSSNYLAGLDWNDFVSLEKVGLLDLWIDSGVVSGSYSPSLPIAVL